VMRWWYVTMMPALSMLVLQRLSESRPKRGFELQWARITPTLLTLVISYRCTRRRTHRRS